MQTVYSAHEIFTGEERLQDHAVIIEQGVVEDIVPVSQLSGDIVHQHFPDSLLVPAFIDAQVYGAAQKLFSVFPEPDTLQTMHQVFIQQGTCLFQPTIATNTLTVFKQCIDAVRAYWEQGGKGVHGLHLEGPWLNPEKRGAHVKEFMYVPTKEAVKELLDYGKDVITMITLAPEIVSDEIIELILSYNIVISAGHSNATYEQASRSFSRGITSVTHLYNAMSPLHHREPGLVGATFNHDWVRSSIIPDGHHVDYAAIAIAKKIMGSRLFAITDAVTGTTSGPYQHYLAGDKYESNGTLSGSAISMYQAFYNLVQQVGIEVDEALRMCSLYPAQVLNLGHRYGKIAPRYAGQFLVLNKQLKLVGVLN